jgi:tetratricopeptide (TPR) repeat protein
VRIVLLSAILVALVWPLQAQTGTAKSPAQDPEQVLAQVAELFAKSAYASVVPVLNELLARTNLSPGHRARGLEQLAKAQSELGQHDNALASADGAAEQARKIGDDRQLARLHLVRGSVERYRGRPMRAIEHYERAIDAARPIGAGEVTRTALSAISSAYQQLGDWARGLDYAERSFALNPAPTDAERFRYLVLRGIAQFEFFEGAAARRSFEDALALALKTDDRRGQSLAWGEIGLTLWEFDPDKNQALDAFATSPCHPWNWTG